MTYVKISTNQFDVPQQPENTPTISKPTPIVLDEMLVETTVSNQAPYDRFLEFGHLYPDQIKYPGFKFLACKPTQYGQVQYIWGNGFVSQDSYNAAKNYAENANGYPIFVRSYRVLRSDYLVNGPATKLLPFTGVAAVAVTAGGTGYANDFAVSFSGGSGSGATATAIVFNGAVVRVEITNVGSGYTAAPTVGFGAGTGSSAAATATIQPAAAVLIEEVHEKLPEDDPYSSLYDKVTRTYKTEPGPNLVGAELSDECQGAVASTGVQEILSSTAEYVPDFGSLSYSDTPIDANRKSRRITYAEHGFPVITDIFYQMEKNGRKITTTYEVVPTTTITGSPAPLFKQELHKINKLRSLLVTTVWDQVSAYSEYEDAAYPFPALFSPDTYYAWSDACGAFSNIQTRREILTQIRTDHSWSSTPPPMTPTGFLILRPRTHLAGRGWQIFEGTINNDFPFTYTGGCTDTYDFVASVPNYSTYAALVQDLGGSGTPQLVSARVTLDEDLMWHYANRYLQIQ